MMQVGGSYVAGADRMSLIAVVACGSAVTPQTRRANSPRRSVHNEWRLPKSPRWPATSVLIVRRVAMPTDAPTVSGVSSSLARSSGRIELIVDRTRAAVSRRLHPAPVLALG